MKQTVSTRLNPDVLRALQTLADREQRTLSDMARLLLESAISRAARAGKRK